MTAGPLEASEPLGQLHGARAHPHYLEIVEAVHNPAENRVRGRVAGEGWVSMENTIDGFRFVHAVPLGTYKVTATTVVTSHLPPQPKGQQF